MEQNKHEYGRVPASRRRLFAMLCLVMATAVVVGGLAINAVTGTSVQWGWLLVAVGFVGAIFAFYLWIRLSD